MTWLFNNPSEFAKEMVAGFISANAEVVRQVPGGVIRNTQSQPGTVAIVIGGGSGHYPAFAGLVGQGLAHGAAMGNLFASPSAQQICAVAKAAHNGAGVLLAFGNYAGDVLHFGLARDRLIAEGIPCELIAVTDDITSAAKNEMEKRRGVAGDLVVFKAAAAAAEQGASLEAVLAVARHANNRTRTIGVAFSGCTLPGAEHPLFTVPEGRMGFGMGIHGEPGISEMAIPGADELAAMLVEHLLNDIPPGVSVNGARVGAILNGLGSVKYEELFVLWHNVQLRLSDRGIILADIQIGEFVTSFDMAGLSLTLTWFTDELEALWLAPANSPAFKRGSVIVAQPLQTHDGHECKQETVPVASEASRAAAVRVVAMMDALADVVIENVDELGRIDAVAGDGDHGIGMERGVRAARDIAHHYLALGAGAGTILQQAADAWADKAGGTSGAIWGVILNTIGTGIGNQRHPQAAVVAQAVNDAALGVMHFGKARPGDKTLVDVLLPFSEVLIEEVEKGLPLPQAWNNAACHAEKYAQDTAQLLPKIGRARPLAERSLGTPDAGAVSLAMIVTAVSRCFTAIPDNEKEGSVCQ
ncbi:TPA: dihydroxyacetone kinase family protein [Klebsiella quasipneumoniae subsp. quasipneumoniae]|uniref:dihydroxyacetone kinase family protein n=1 Tax=Klebsiella quasipneumoniae TaxID=1463165 RepID=UPI00298AB038|nr:dihydroxyacetone kinase family protein [Klebsiella quasipneumoniae subsp. quasipneumoniae]HBR1675120.1 dihydroxyacetone kinase family protein [Klebsiella quasipneumoniae subsp. quasipneumoniae]HBV4315529.1 dihydroxyacetone kinase family protein [Klebsiella quasipneumoniae]HDH1545537.1 dihydroxyacetone kinase family protein [Klebsiella quasipneumoniae subsp. quasipneumoniae]